MPAGGPALPGAARDLGVGDLIDLVGADDGIVQLRAIGRIEPTLREPELRP